MTRFAHHAPTPNALPITVTGRRMNLNHEVRDYAQDRLATALRRFAPRLREASVWLEDVNGPRRGVDKLCRINVRLKSGGQVTVSAEADSEYAAVAQAAERAAALLNRKHKRTWMARHGRKGRRINI